MRKIMLMITLILGCWFGRPDTVEAGGCNACGHWTCITECGPDGCTQSCSCDDCLPDLVTGICGPGLYVCNRGGFGQCCAIGGTPGVGGGGGYTYPSCGAGTGLSCVGAGGTGYSSHCVDGAIFSRLNRF